MPDQIVGVHLVSSVPYSTAKEAFTKVAKVLPGRVKHLHDGETGRRSHFARFQSEIFQDAPHILRQYDAKPNTKARNQPTEAELKALKQTLTKNPLNTKYDELALETYKTFQSLRASGTISRRTKFQVCIPTPFNSICNIADGYQATVAPFYEDAVSRSVKELVFSIPHSDLAIQWDVCAEFAITEGVREPHFTVWLGPPLKGKIIEKLVKLVDLVPPDIECGLHLCYGDVRHKHFYQPKDAGHFVDVAKSVKYAANRPLDFIHMPVPKDRIDDEYFAPLKGLDLDGTVLFLGVVHGIDVEGTSKQVETVRKHGISLASLLNADVVASTQAA